MATADAARPEDGDTDRHPPARDSAGASRDDGGVAADATPRADDPGENAGGDQAVAAGLTVEVARTGGVAGLTRRWQAAPDPPAASHWRALIEACPWDAPAAGSDTAGADRFTWEVCVEVAAERREAALPESAATGPWRTLIDEVRAWHRHHQPPAD